MRYSLTDNIMWKSWIMEATYDIWRLHNILYILVLLLNLTYGKMVWQYTKISKIPHTSNIFLDEIMENIW